MNLTDWQSNPALAEELNKTLDLPIMQMAQEVIDSMSPTRQIAVLSHEVVRDNSQFQLGKIAGFHERDLAMSVLRTAAKEIRQPEASYPDPNQPRILPKP